ncbi:MAG: hypothetical protein QME81_20280, partial [bacterium]|nr:hypothetical protein [bacterium]
MEDPFLVIGIGYGRFVVAVGIWARGSGEDFVLFMLGNGIRNRSIVFKKKILGLAILWSSG